MVAAVLTHGMSASSEVDVLEAPDGGCFVVVSPVTCEVTYVITIDPISGNPFYAGVPFVDQFPEHAMAVAYLEQRGAKKKVAGCGLIGVLQCNHVTTIGVVTKAEATGALPGGHVVWTVRDAAFVDIRGPRSGTKGSGFDDFQINGCHYFCETYNLTQLFPSDGKPVDGGFVWNAVWKKAFVKLGVGEACVDLLQGVCRSADFGDFGMTYVARRSVLNPGTRFIARGLNDKNAPGNEVECELIFVKGDKFWTVKWRRGSIPIRWKTVNNGVNVKHSVGQDFFNGTKSYFDGLRERYDGIEVRCISLLRDSEDHAEEEIKYYFVKAVRQLYEEGVTGVQLCPFDLNKIISDKGSAVALVEFMKFIKPITEKDGMTSGTLPNEIVERQHAIQRFNCADSLDRTNLATFYYAMKVTAEWCLKVKTGIGDECADYTTPNKIVIQPVIDFLASSFVEAGNVISYMYTNTPAIRAKAIKKFSKTVEKQIADAAVTMKRLYENMINDRQRMKIIEQWTTPFKFKWIHRLDPRYFAIVPRSGNRIPSEIVGSVMKQFQLARDQNEILLVLPCPMQLLSVYILAHPSSIETAVSRVTISVGNSLDDMSPLCSSPFPIPDAAVWLKYNLLKAERWGIGASKYRRWARLVSIRFDVDGDSFIIGNVKLETRSIIANRPEMEEFRLTPANDDVFSQFNKAFEQFTKSKQRVDDVLELETKRLSLRIPEMYRTDKAVDFGMNPWRCDPEGQIGALKPSQCPVCKKYVPVGNTTDVDCYKQGEACKGVLLKTEEKTTLRVCKNCRSRVAPLAEVGETLERECQPLSKGIPVFRVVQQDPGLFQKSQVMSCDSCAVVLEDSTGFVWGGGKVVQMPANSKRDITLFLTQPSIIVEVHLLVRGEGNVLVTDQSRRVEGSKADGKFIFTYPENPVTQMLHLTLESDGPVEIQDLQVMYIPSEKPVEIQSFAKHAAPIGLRPSQVKSSFDAASRTDTFKFPPATIRRFQLVVAADESAPSPQSFIFACYKDKALEHSETILLPEVEAGKKLWFFLSKAVLCDQICVFYIDRQPAIKPHSISLSFEP